LAASLGLFGVSQNLDRLLSMMIIDYGTGIRVAAPTSILACMAAAARQGILIKGGSQMERLAKADTLVFDKTGTLTRGTPHVVDVLSYNKRSFPVPKVLQIAAALEQRVNHPIAEAIVDHAREWNLEIPDRDASKYQVGLGVEARVNGYYVHLGSCRFLRASGIKMDRARRDVRRLDERGCSTVIMAVNGELVGAVACADEIRPESRDVIRALHNSGIKKVMMVTGDNSATARTVAQELGIDRVIAETMPDEKASIVQQLQKEGRTVVMVGDGINDSPALAYADVGIAMKNGTDIARESADVVLMEDNLWKLPAAIEFSHRALSLVRQNYGIIVGLNTLATLLALPGGLVNAATIATLSNGSAILAGLNAIRPLLGSTA
jgi:heavy metal translocating P-type ATPase